MLISIAAPTPEVNQNHGIDESNMQLAGKKNWFSIEVHIYSIKDGSFEVENSDSLVRECYDRYLYIQGVP